jgi:catechol 2,3-dioxygenase-like lactoylglutathione lyase family enzyme
MENQISHIIRDYETGRLTRRQLIAHLGGLVALAGGAGQLAGQENQGGGSTFQATELNHLALRVTDVARSRDFYMKHLGLTLAREGGNNAFLNFGQNFVALFQGDQAGMDHYCYSVKNYDVAEAEEKLKAGGLKDIRRTSGRIYFSDPDGLTVQLAAEQHAPN